MITYQTIAKQIEKLATEASNASNDQQIREKLTAIRALCEVVLDETNVPQKAQNYGMANGISTVSPIVSYAQPVMPSSQKLKEDGANGESLFDF